MDAGLGGPCRGSDLPARLGGGPAVRTLLFLLGCRRSLVLSSCVELVESDQWTQELGWAFLTPSLPAAAQRLFVTLPLTGQKSAKQLLQAGTFKGEGGTLFLFEHAPSSPHRPLFFFSRKAKQAAGWSVNFSHCSMESYASGYELADPRSTPVSGDQGGSSVMCLIMMPWQQPHCCSGLRFMDLFKSNDFSGLGVNKKC